MNTDAHVIVTSMVRELADEMDAKILAFFGSEELAKEYMHLFVIEQLPIGFSTIPSEEGNPQIIYHAEVELRIRPKTLEELQAEKNV